MVKTRLLQHKLTKHTKHWTDRHYTNTISYVFHLKHDAKETDCSLILSIQLRNNSLNEKSFTTQLSYEALLLRGR